MRELEAFALWCGDVFGDGIQIERSWYKSRSPSGERSERLHFSVDQYGDPTWPESVFEDVRLTRSFVRSSPGGSTSPSYGGRIQVCTSGGTPTLEIIADQQGTQCGPIWTTMSRVGRRSVRRKRQSVRQFYWGVLCEFPAELRDGRHAAKSWLFGRRGAAEP
jgi:hypothetical protein